MVGEEGTDAVLCTENETYSVVRVETSNDVFLVPPATPAEAADGERDTFEVTARCNYYYEVPRLYIGACLNSFDLHADVDDITRQMCMLRVNACTVEADQTKH